MHDGYSADVAPRNLDGAARPGRLTHDEHDTEEFATVQHDSTEPLLETSSSHDAPPIRGLRFAPIIRRERQSAIPVGETLIPTGDSLRDERRRRSATWEIVETLLLAVFIFIAVRSVVLNFRVDGQSMEPTLDSGQMLLVNRQVYFHFDAYELVNWIPFVEFDGDNVVYPFHPPQRGDIVILHPPVDQGKPYIKRVIGLPGERIAIRDGAVYINGERLVEEYLNGVATVWSGSIGEHEITIQDGEVFVMGDNRNNSTDSRIFGPVEIDEIIGKAWISYWPADRLDILSSPDYSP